MVVVNKKAFYPNMMQYAPPLQGHYQTQTNVQAEKYIENYSLINYQHPVKILNTFVAGILGILTIWAAAVTLGRSYSDSRMPMHILSYSMQPWDEYSKFTDTLKTFTNASSTRKDNVQKLWAWSRCDEYITKGRVPKSSDKSVIEVVSATNPVYIPGGCNCIAQVAHAMGDGWLYASATAPSKDEVEEMINLCTYEGSMPHTLAVHDKTYRTMFYMYAFLFLAASSIIVANFMHDVVVSKMKSVADTNAQTTNNMLGALRTKLMVVVGIVVIITYVFTILLVSLTKSAPEDAKHPELAFTISYFLVSAFFFTLFVVPYFMYENISDAAKKFAEHEVDTGMQIITSEIRDSYTQSNILNAQGQIEQLWTDVISIPAVVSLTVAVCVLRQWTDFDIILYNALLVFLFLVFTTAGNWVTNHWTRVITLMDAQKADIISRTTTMNPEIRKLENIEKNLDSFYGGYKNIITMVQVFILIALAFTATPAGDISHYNYLAMYNWVYLLIFLFVIYVFPDMWNDYQPLKLHTVTAMKQFFLNILIFLTFLTVSYTEIANKSAVN